MEDQTKPETVNSAEARWGRAGGIIAFLALIALILTVAFAAKPRTGLVETTLPSESKDMTSVTDESLEVTQIKAGSFYYQPAVLRVRKGEKVKLELTAVDMMHDFNVDELNIKSPIVKSGESAIVEFIVDKVGEFEFYCSVGKHRDLGQTGKLIVEE